MKRSERHAKRMEARAERRKKDYQERMAFWAEFDANNAKLREAAERLSKRT